MTLIVTAHPRQSLSPGGLNAGCTIFGQTFLPAMGFEAMQSVMTQDVNQRNRDPLVSVSINLHGRAETGRV